MFLLQLWLPSPHHWRLWLLVCHIADTKLLVRVQIAIADFTASHCLLSFLPPFHMCTLACETGEGLSNSS